MIFIGNSLLDGFLLSNLVGKAIVVLQFLSSVAMGAVAFGKLREILFVTSESNRFERDFLTSKDVLDYYLVHRPDGCSGTKKIYKDTCDHLLKLLSNDARSRLLQRDAGEFSSVALTAREVNLVRGTCDCTLEKEIKNIEHTMSMIATVVALAPMLGLLGTVWGVLDAFAEMGSAGSANLATIAPAISSALVTTVVGLLIAMPGVCCFNYLNSRIRELTIQMEAFADKIMGLIACEFQGRES